MEKAFNSNDTTEVTSMPQLLETRAAFDSVAADYDGPRGNNELIRQMRAEMWRWLHSTFSPGGRLIDLGCGTGLDAVHLAEHGYQITATDWAPQMIERTRARAASHQVAERLEAVNVGAQELDRLPGALLYDGAYSNLGPLNCVPDLDAVSRQCARLIKPGGSLLFTVIGRICPWELVHYLRRGRWARAKIRFASGVVAVGMNKQTIWTRYYRPMEFYRHFEREFKLEHYRGLCVAAPPPYLTWLHEKAPRVQAGLWRLDRRVAAWPVIRSMGDHFLIHMRKR